MTYRLELLPEAFADVAEAFSWYEARRPGLGTEFEGELDRAPRFVVAMPTACPVVHRSLRRALVRRFPFAVYYTTGTDVVLVRSFTPVGIPGRGAVVRKASLESRPFDDISSAVAPGTTLAPGP